MDHAQSTWKIRHSNRFLRQIMTYLAGDAHVCFEGNSPILRTLLELPGASDQETPVLKRQTISPHLNFVIVPLKPDTIDSIFVKLGGSLPRDVIHVAMEKNGELAFGEYDRFHPECIYFGNAVSEEMLASLTTQKLLKRES